MDIWLYGKTVALAMSAEERDDLYNRFPGAITKYQRDGQEAIPVRLPLIRVLLENADFTIDRVKDLG